MLGVSKTAILDWMREFEIPRRRQAESLSSTVKKLWKMPEYRAKMMIHLKEYWSRSGERSENSKKSWKKSEFRLKMSQMHKDVWKRPEYKLKMNKIRKSLWQTPEYRSKMIEARIRQWSDPEYKDRVLQKSRKSIVKKPTKPEQIIRNLIEAYHLPFRYTGDGEVMIKGLNPDFVHENGERKIIEVFGRVFHDPEKSFFNVPWKQQYLGKILEYKKRGYDCLILWDNESEDKMLNKMREFA